MNINKYFRNTISKVYCNFFIFLYYFFNAAYKPSWTTSAQLEDRIVNPDLRNHSLRGPIINPEIMTGRAPYWASGAKNAAKIVSPNSAQAAGPQNCILNRKWQSFDCMAALSTTCPHFCPGGLQVLFFTQEDQIAIRIQQSLRFSETVEFFISRLYTCY